MSRINTNVSSLIAQRVLRRNNNNLNTSLERLSTGLKINKGADNPAGLIASENLRAEKTGISQAIDNAERASNMIGTAEGGLGEISSLLTELEGLVNEAANKGGLSTEEIEANQLQVDSILTTINRIAQSTSFQGIKLLNGNYSYTTSGAGTANFDTLTVNAARLPANAATNVVVQVTQSAQTAVITSVATGLTATPVTVEVAGNKGTEQISFAAGTTVAQMVTAVNAVKDATGVSAVASGTALKLNSTDYGLDQYVSLKAVSGSITGEGKDYGRDAAVLVNGASATAKGLNVTFRNSNLDIEFDMKSAFNTAGSANFYISGGGATFSLGSKVTETDKASVGIASVTTGSLGSATLGFLSSLSSGATNALSGKNLVTAQKIVDKAVKQVSQLRGRLGAFQRFTIGATVNSLGVAFENASAAESAIRDTDFAEETAAMTRSQILSQAATTVLAQANASPQNALALLQ